MTLTAGQVRDLIGDRYVFEYDLDTEMEILRQLDELFAGANVFWDIGSHAGLYSVIASKLYPSLDIYCFEASKFTRENILEDNVNDLNKITIVPYALADQPGTVTFQESGVGQTNNSLVSTTVAPDDYEKINIEAHSARSAVKELGVPAPDAVKLDVEGAEYRVLQGFNDHLFDTIEMLIIELHYINTRDSSTIPYIKQKGFNTEKLSEREMKSSYKMEHYKAKSN